MARPSSISVPGTGSILSKRSDEGPPVSSRRTPSRGGGGGWGTKAGFELARKALGSKVEDLSLDVLDLSPDRIGTLDLAFVRVSSVTKVQLILETHVDLLGNRKPTITFYADDDLHRDSTNWCDPN